MRIGWGKRLYVFILIKDFNHLYSERCSTKNAPDVKILPKIPGFDISSIIRIGLFYTKETAMAKTLDKKELSDLLAAVRRAGFAEGYAQAKMDNALGQIASSDVTEQPPITEGDIIPVGQLAPDTAIESSAESNDDNFYKTRTTVKTTKAIALDYLKSVAPRVVGPTEIKKNSERSLKIFISFGTLKRATTALVDEGKIEQVEESRWRYKNSSNSAEARTSK